MVMLVIVMVMLVMVMLVMVTLVMVMLVMVMLVVVMLVVVMVVVMVVMVHGDGDSDSNGDVSKDKCNTEHSQHSSSKPFGHMSKC